MDEQFNNLVSQNLALLSSYPIGYYSHLWNENSELKKENNSLEESNRKLRKRNFDYKDKIDELEDRLTPPKKLAKNSKYEFTKYRRTKSSFDENQINRTLYNIKSIQDVISLKNKWKEIRHDNVLQRLYNIIPPLEQLNDMIGLESVKKNIFKKIIYYVRNPQNDDYLHTIIAGPPGVGKTELSKIYAQIFVRLGILKNDKFIEIKRDDLVAKYLGQTAPKTRKLLDDAMGGVIFLDEAYSLGNEDKRDSFSKEAIDMINQYLSEKKNEFMMIVAGYDDELDKCFFSFNPGLKRRFSSYYKIESYSENELCKIFKIKISKTKYNLNIDDSKLNKFFKDNYKEFKYFGGDVEKVISEIKYTQSFRTFNENIDSNDIILKDLQDAYDAFKSNLKEKEKYLPPYGMYI